MFHQTINISIDSINLILIDTLVNVNNDIIDTSFKFKEIENEFSLIKFLKIF